MRIESLSLGLRFAFRFGRAFRGRKREDVGDALLDLLLAQTVLERGHSRSGDAFGDQMCQICGGEFAVAQLRGASAGAPGGVAISHTARTEVDSLAGLDLAFGALRLRGARPERKIKMRKNQSER